MRFILAVLIASICLIQLAESNGYSGRGAYGKKRYEDNEYEVKKPVPVYKSYKAPPTYETESYGQAPYKYKLRKEYNDVWVQNVNKNKNRNEDETSTENESKNENININDLIKLKELLEKEYGVSKGGYSTGYRK